MLAEALSNSRSASDAEGREALAPQWKARALRAIQLGDAWQAWLWADTLCRRTRGPSRADAFMLRSVALAMQGNSKAANDDILTAAQLDPDSVPLNRMLLSAADLKTRIVAAAALLRASEPEDRRRGMSALSRGGFGCAGTAKLQDGRLVLDLAWNGRRHLSLTIKTDVGEEAVEVAAGSGQKVEGFAYAAVCAFDLPAEACAVSISVRSAKAIIEPRTFVLPKAPPHANAAVGIDADLLIVIPVYEDRDATIACLEALFVAVPSKPSCKIVVVDDASPDSSLSAWLQERANDARIHLLRNAVNMGFAASVNRAIAMRRVEQDVLLLNADTIVPEGAIETLARHFVDDERIGTATPLSNNGEDTSFPRRFHANPLPSRADIGELQRIASRVNRDKAVDMPNGVGFCLYIRGSLLDRLGPLSLEFDRGYFEDVEFCLRAAAAGYKNICATDVYVGHHGSRSFGTEKRTLVSRNLKRLTAVHGGYRMASESFQRADPLRELIGRIEEEFLRVRAAKTHLLVVPADTPSVLCAALERRQVNGRSIVVRVTQKKGMTQLVVRGAKNAAPQNITWLVAMGRDGEVEIARRLRDLRVRSATILDVDALPIDVAKAVTAEADETEFIVASTYQRVAKGRGAIRTLLPSRRAIRQASVVAATPAIAEVLSRPGGGMRATTADVPDLATAARPQLVAGSGLLAIVGMKGSTEDHALVTALAAALPGDASRLCVVCAGAGTIGEPPNRVHFAGKVADEDLATWLTRLRAQAILFADRKWGIADPRAAAWAQHGLAIACFGHAASALPEAPAVFSDSDKPETIAVAIARWLSAQAV